MKLLTYKLIHNISSWLGVTKKWNKMPLSNTWRATPKHNATLTEPARTLWARLRICRNRISPPSLDVILAQGNCSDDQTGVNLGEEFQVPGRTETVRGRGANRFTPRRSVISYSRSDVRGSRLNMAHDESWLVSQQKQAIFLFSKVFVLGLGSTQPPVGWVMGRLSSVIRRP